MPVRGLGPSCCVHGCMRPVRELGGYCIQHFMALSPLQRRCLQDDAEWGLDAPVQPTEPIDSLAIARWSGLLDEIAALPEYTGERKWAA